MKKVNMIYWISTALLALMMLFSSIPSLMNSPESIEMMNKALGYPMYIIPFLGVAKLLGAIAVLIPGYPRIKEWVYAGFAYDLIGATYSLIAIGKTPMEVSFMVLPFTLVAVSYIYFHKREGLKKAN